MLHHGIESDIGVSINITVAPKNEDSQEREFGQSFPALSLEQRCGMMIRDMYCILESFEAQLDSKVRSCSKWGSPILKDYTKSNSGLNKKTSPTPSLDKVHNKLFEDWQGRCKPADTSLGTKPTGGLFSVMSVPSKRDLSHPFEPGSYFLAPYE